MFTGFNEKTFDFLWGIRFNNNKQWFSENKQLFTENVQTPMRELANEVRTYMKEKRGLDAGLHISRIYRDARYSGNGDPYRDRLWFSLRREKENWTETPVFFFEIIPEGYTFGMGYYEAKASTMLKFRTKIDEEPEIFLSAVKNLDMNGTFENYGEKYKRSKSKDKGNMPPRLAEWYDLKNIGVIARRPAGPEVYSEELSGIVREGFEILLPLYNFLWSLEG